MILAGVFILKMGQKSPTPGLVVTEQAHYPIVLTRVNTSNNHWLFLYNVSSTAYESCVIVVRGDRYRVEHNRFGLDVSNCRRCICQNGQLDDSTCVNGRSCVFITPGGKKSCKYNGTKYSNGEVFPTDECNTCKCLNGEITECTHMDCNMTPTCEQCRCMPEEEVCCDNGFATFTVCNTCVAQFCAEVDPDSCTNGPCQSANPEVRNIAM